MTRTAKMMESLLPPVVKRGLLFLLTRNYYAGTYRTWAEARGDATGYDADVILEKCKTALLKVKSGEAAYERDSVVFETMEHPFAVLAGLLKGALASDGRLSVLDFGGSLGSTYYQCRHFLADLKTLRWNIVEQGKFVACGREHFETEELRFYDTVGDCLRQGKPDVLLLSSVLQYIEEPHALLKELLREGIGIVIVDRTPFHQQGSRDILTVQNVPFHIYRASYPCWLFSRERFLASFAGAYSIAAEYDALGGTIDTGRMAAAYRGFIFQHREGFRDAGK